MQNTLGLVHRSRQDGTLAKGINLAYMRRWEFRYGPPHPEQPPKKTIEESKAMALLTVYLDEDVSVRFEGRAALRLRDILEQRSLNLEHDQTKDTEPHAGEPDIAIVVEGGTVQEVVTTLPGPVSYRIIDRDVFKVGETAITDEMAIAVKGIAAYLQERMVV